MQCETGRGDDHSNYVIARIVSQSLRMTVFSLNFEEDTTAKVAKSHNKSNTTFFALCFAQDCALPKTSSSPGAAVGDRCRPVDMFHTAGTGRGKANQLYVSCGREHAASFLCRELHIGYRQTSNFDPFFSCRVTVISTFYV